MTDKPESCYHDLADWAESHAPSVHPEAAIEHGTSQRHEEVRAMLEADADSQEQRAAIRRAGGRPRLDPNAPSGESPLWQVRAPRSLDQAMRELAKAQGRSLSDVLRVAAAAYIATHRDS